MTQSVLELQTHYGYYSVFAVHSVLVAILDSVSPRAFLTRYLQSIGLIITARTIHLLVTKGFQITDQESVDLTLQTPIEILDFMVAQSSEDARVLFTVLRDLTKIYYLTWDATPKWRSWERFRWRRPSWYSTPSHYTG
jgi:hypothetical protein